MIGPGRVGIFWAVPDNGGTTLVTDTTELGVAEPYGDFLTHPGGHYEIWEAWRALGLGGLRRRGLPSIILAYEYEHFPRGRVVFHQPDRRFTAYADRRLLGHAFRARILAAFGLPAADTAFMADAHYRTGPLLGRLRGAGIG